MKFGANTFSDFYHSLFNSAQLRQLKNEYDSKPIVRYGLWSVLGTLIFYIALVISDEADEVHGNLKQLNARLAKIEHVQSERFWFDRLAVEKRNIQSIEKAIREANTKSLAKAQMQANFTSFSKDDIEQSRVTVSDPIFFGNYYGKAMYTVNVELRGRVRKGSAFKILENLAMTPFLQEIERFEIEFQQNRQFQLMIKSYFFIPE